MAFAAALSGTSTNAIGNVLGLAVTGMIRLPLLSYHTHGLVYVAELVRRVLSTFLAAAGFNPQNSSIFSKAIKWVDGTDAKKEEQKPLETDIILWRACTYLAIADIGLSLLYPIAGAPHPIYNAILGKISVFNLATDPLCIRLLRSAYLT